MYKRTRDKSTRDKRTRDKKTRDRHRSLTYHVLLALGSQVLTNGQISGVADIADAVITLGVSVPDVGATTSDHYVRSDAGQPMAASESVVIYA